jgi:hypothetical protein
LTRDEGCTGLPDRLVGVPTNGAGREVSESVSPVRLPKKGDCVAKGSSSRKIPYRKNAVGRFGASWKNFE